MKGYKKKPSTFKASGDSRKQSQQILIGCITENCSIRPVYSSISAEKPPVSRFTSFESEQLLLLEFSTQCCEAFRLQFIQ